MPIQLRAFEPVPCDVLITEATFGLPIYRWQPGSDVAEDIRAWWQGDRERPSLLFCYAFGKAQRLLAELHAIGVEEEVLLHGAVETVTRHYREAAVAMTPSRPVSDLPRSDNLAGRLVLAPPSAHRSSWMRRFRSPQTGFASGWMAVRGARRRRGYERGFVLSDHADWPGLLQTVRQSGARKVYVTHGQSDVWPAICARLRGSMRNPSKPCSKEKLIRTWLCRREAPADSGWPRDPRSRLSTTRSSWYYRCL